MGYFMNSLYGDTIMSVFTHSLIRLVIASAGGPLMLPKTDSKTNRTRFQGNVVLETITHVAGVGFLTRRFVLGFVNNTNRLAPYGRYTPGSIGWKQVDSKYIHELPKRVAAKVRHDVDTRVAELQGEGNHIESLDGIVPIVAHSLDAVATEKGRIFTPMLGDAFRGKEAMPQGHQDLVNTGMWPIQYLRRVLVSEIRVFGGSTNWMGIDNAALDAELGIDPVESPANAPVVTKVDDMNVRDIRKKAALHDIKGRGHLKKAELIEALHEKAEDVKGITCDRRRQIANILESSGLLDQEVVLQVATGIHPARLNKAADENNTEPLTKMGLSPITASTVLMTIQEHRVISAEADGAAAV